MRQPLPYNAWLTLWRLQHGMMLAATEVMIQRSIMMAHGSMSSTEAARMVFEKPAAFAQGLEKAAAALARGAGPEAAVAAAIRPVKRRASANARRLRRKR